MREIVTCLFFSALTGRDEPRLVFGYPELVLRVNCTIFLTTIHILENILDARSHLEPRPAVFSLILSFKYTALSSPIHFHTQHIHGKRFIEKSFYNSVFRTIARLLHLDSRYYQQCMNGEKVEADIINMKDEIMRFREKANVC